MSERSAIFALLRLVVLLGVAAGAAVFTWHQYSTSPLLVERSVEQVEIVDVHEVDFDGRSTIVITFSEVERLAVRAQTSGRVTEVTRDARVSAGDLLVRIQDDPVIAFAGDAPLLEDVTVGSKGRNVNRALRFLDAMGFYKGSYDGTAGSGFAAAVRQLNERFDTKPTNSLLQTRTAWIGDSFEELDIELLVAVGDNIQEGEALALGPVLDADVTVDEPDGPANPLVRERTLVGSVDGYDFSYIPGSMVLDSSSSTHLAEGATEGEPLRINLKLQDPLVVVAVPPGAIVAGQPGVSCVIDGQSLNPVTVDLLGEDPGVAFIDPRDAPSRVVTNPWALSPTVECMNG